MEDVEIVPDAGFNSSVGILSIGTLKGISKLTISRNVSIPRSEFCPLGRVI